MSANTEQTSTKDEQRPGTVPAPRTLTDDELSRLLSVRQFGARSFVGRTGDPHLSTALYPWNPDERAARISATAHRLAVRRLRNTPQAALQAQRPDISTFAVAEGDAEVSEVTAVLGRRPVVDSPLHPGSRISVVVTAFLEQIAADRNAVTDPRLASLRNGPGHPRHGFLNSVVRPMRDA
jgi:hypothetical protein